MSSLTRRKTILALLVTLVTLTVSFAGWRAQAGRGSGSPGGSKSAAAAATKATTYALGLGAPPMFATFTVTKTADTNDGVCDADCSLREAITAANANP